MDCEKQSINQLREKKEMRRREVGARGAVPTLLQGERMGENLQYVPEVIVSTVAEHLSWSHPFLP
jgi:hypothetical protein